MTLRVCARCKTPKPLTEFRSDRAKPLGRAYLCNICEPAYQHERYVANRLERQDYHRKRYQANPEPVRQLSREWYRNNKERKRNFNYMRAYGLTTEDVDALIAAQGGRCKLCGNETMLVVDHEHSTGVVRGMLCNKCNRALGAAENLGLERILGYLAAGR